MKRFLTMIILLGLLAPAAPGFAAYKGGSVNDGGTITGMVFFKGTPPMPEKYTPTKDTHVCGTDVHTSDEWVVGPDRGVKNAVVSLTDITQGAPLDKNAPSQLNQTGCRFVPHVALIPRGGTMEILNSDGILHNVRSTSIKNAPFNKAQPKFMKKIRQTFVAGPEKIRVNCDAHSWMSAWIVVQEHPYYAVTDDSGSFTLSNVPAGTYTIEYWHERFGVTTSTVTVTAKGTVTANASFGEE